MDNLPIIKLENIKKTYQENVDALDDISLTINKGEFVFIVGPSGSGKSTLIKLILKQIDATSGKLIVNGKDVSSLKRRQVSKYRRDIGVVFQNFKLLKDRSVFENVALAQRVIGIPKWNMEKNVSAMLSTVGLLDKAKANPKELSGGEQQRVAIARAIVNEPAILLADEPTGNLDPTNSWEIMKLLEEANDRGTTVLVVTHNQEIVNEMQKRVVTMKKGVIVSDEKKGGYKHEN